MTSEKSHALVREYRDIEAELKTVMSRKVTRRRKVAYARQLAILHELGDLNPQLDTQAVIALTNEVQP